jgi:hypothetical protein
MMHLLYSPDDIALFKLINRIFITTIALFLISSLPVRSQSNHIYSNGYEPEKIYLQPDGKVYTTDKTIWIKAIVTSASDHYISRLSGVLYVELIGPDEKIREKKLIKLENGIGTGFFDLDKAYPEGRYLIRAFTEWNRNFGSDFFFKEYIQVYAPSRESKPDPVRNITVLENGTNGRRLSAYFDPLAIDSLHKKDLTIFITSDRKKDSLSLKMNEDNKYLLDYPVPDSCQFITLKMLTKNLSGFTKTVVLDEDHLNLNFFPESGELVHGIKSRIGVKALEYNGKGKTIAGDIINGKGEVLTRFKSNKLGMGRFTLDNPDKDDTYYARIKSQRDSNLLNIYPLPEVIPQGNVLSITRNGGEIVITASSNYLKNDSIYIIVSCRGLVYYEIKGKLNEGVLAFSLPADKLPDGIIAFTMTDNNVHPVAERISFNERPESRLNIEISADKDTYIQRELTSLNIKTTDNQSRPVPVSLSLLVLNKSQLGQIQSSRQNILSYFLLSSDLRGEIENPGYYFTGNSNYDDLDALMLTQGWRKYLYTKPVETVRFQPEPSLTVTGSVGGVFLQSRKRKAGLTLMTFGRHKSVKTQMTDSLGRFNFNINDEYGQNVNILIQSTNRIGQTKNYSIILDKKESPPVLYDHIVTIGKADSVIKKVIENNITQKKIEDTYKLSKGILLGEVKVEAYRLTPLRKKMMQDYGKPVEVIDGEILRENEEKWSYGLYSVLESKFQDKIRIFKVEGELLAEIRKSAPTLVMVDGIAVNHDDFGAIAYIPPSEVSSFEIIKNIKNTSKVWFEFCPECDPLTLPQTIDVIAIYTYGGNGLYGVHKATGIIKASVPVFSTPREFYTPKYANLKPGDWYKPDLRSLIDWEPNLSADSSGVASASYYNADIEGNMQVVVEAISEDGKIGYQELTYNVRKRDMEKEKLR